MPWLIQHSDNEYCVFKKGPDGEPTGDSLGCHPSEEEAQQQVQALYANAGEEAKSIVVIHRRGPAAKMNVRLGDFAIELTAVKAMEGHKLLVLGVPFGSPENKDADGEFFSEKTDLMLKVGETRPLVYFHGMNPNGRPLQHPEVIGTATYIKKDEKGHWFEAVLDMTKALAKRIWDKAVQGLVRASSGALPHLVRMGKAGEILAWGLGELSLIDLGIARQPANMQAVAIPLKTMFSDAGMPMPEAFDEALAGSVEADKQPEEEANASDIAAAVTAYFDAKDAAAQAEAALYASVRAELEEEQTAPEAAEPAAPPLE
jgi:hypothetical protein